MIFNVLNNFFKGLAHIFFFYNFRNANPKKQSALIFFLLCPDSIPQIFTSHVYNNMYLKYMYMLCKHLKLRQLR